MLSPDFGTDATFEACLQVWETDVAKYEKELGAALSDDVKLATVVSRTKGALRDHLTLNINKVTSYKVLRELVPSYYKQRSAFKALPTTPNHSPFN